VASTRKSNACSKSPRGLILHLRGNPSADWRGRVATPSPVFTLPGFMARGPDRLQGAHPIGPCAHVSSSHVRSGARCSPPAIRNEAGGPPMTRRLVDPTAPPGSPHPLFSRVVGRASARIRAHRDEGDLVAASNLLRNYPGETHDAILETLELTAPVGPLWRYARVPSARHTPPRRRDPRGQASSSRRG
jgi:hypothetical protein